MILLVIGQLALILWPSCGLTCVVTIGPNQHCGNERLGDPWVLGRKEAKETMSFQLLLIAAAIGVVPVVSRLIKAIVELLVRLVATAFTVLLIVIVVAAFASHGRLL